MHPVPYPISTPYGVPGNWAAGVHTGTDYACPEGTPVVAAAGGTVRLAEWQGDYGYRVDVQTNDNTRQHSYSHLKAIQAWPGQHLTEGQPIGLSGNTGRSTGPHLHYEERKGPHFSYWDHAAPIYPGSGQSTPQPGTEDQEDEDMFIAEAPNRGAALFAPGYYKSLTLEERDVLTDMGVRRTQHNDRGFDVARAAMLQGSDSVDTD